MIITKIIGGLGNQMFQYALGRHLAIKNKTVLKLDTSEFLNYKLHNYSLDNFNIKATIANSDEIRKLRGIEINPHIKSFFNFIKLSKFINKSITDIKEVSYKFDPKILELGDNVYLNGYWQSEKYFINIHDIIKQDFTIKFKIEGLNLLTFNKISSTNSISIHIRRGDYVTNQKTNQFHGTCTIDYYKRAAKIISDKVDHPVFYIFSDDPKWVKSNLKLYYPMVFVTHNNSEKNYEDLRLMSSCQHNIIANSTFSWWAAYLNNNPKKIIIAPKQWFNNPEIDTRDLIPNSWLRI